VLFWAIVMRAAAWVLARSLTAIEDEQSRRRLARAAGVAIGQL
jgi:hypothetical protein